MNRDDPYVETAILGKMAEEFIGSDIGKYIVARAELEAREANDALKRVFPLRWRRVMQLQNQIKVAESIQGWLVDAITDGQAAMKTIQGEEE